MYKTNLTGTGFINLKGGPTIETLFSEISCRIVGDIKIFNARGTLKSILQGRALEDHIKKARDAATYAGDCKIEVDQYYKTDDPISIKNMRFKKSVNFTRPDILCKCGNSFRPFTKAQVLCGNCKMREKLRECRL